MTSLGRPHITVKWKNIDGSTVWYLREREELKSVKTLLHSPRRFPVSNGCKLEPVKTNSLIAQLGITHTSHIFVFAQCFQKVF